MDSEVRGVAGGVLELGGQLRALARAYSNAPARLRAVSPAG
jgi:hypothetical protein